MCLEIIIGAIYHCQEYFVVLYLALQKYSGLYMCTIKYLGAYISAVIFYLQRYRAKFILQGLITSLKIIMGGICDPYIYFCWIIGRK